MTQATTQSTLTSHTIAVEHVRISPERPFAEVRPKLEGMLPGHDRSLVTALRSGDQQRARQHEVSGPELSIEGEINHGVLLQIAGGKRNALQYQNGNPLTATKMTRHRLPAALYVPLRVLLFENEQCY